VILQEQTEETEEEAFLRSPCFLRFNSSTQICIRRKQFRKSRGHFHSRRNFTPLLCETGLPLSVTSPADFAVTKTVAVVFAGIVT